MATMKDVADEVGVSVAVVSAVLNGSESVRASEKTRVRVREVASRLGYVPNYAAQNLRKAKTDVLAVVVPRLGDPVYAPMLEGIYEAAAQIGCSVMLGDEAQATVNADFLRRLTGHGHVDGVLLRAHRVARDLLRELTMSRRPIVALDRTDSGHWLALDDRAGISRGTHHLLSHGHRQVGFFGGLAADGQTERRIEAFHHTMRDAGLTPSPAWTVLCDQSPEAGYDAARTFFGLGQPAPSAVVINNVTTAQGVVAAMTDCGLQIPADISVVALHDSHLAEFIRPGLDTVRLPMRELGIQGVQALERLRSGHEVTSGYIAQPEPEVIVRGSVARPGDLTPR